MTIEDQVASKEAELAEYEGVVQRYVARHGQGRWYHNGVDRLNQLRSELHQLKTAARGPTG